MHMKDEKNRIESKREWIKEKQKYWKQMNKAQVTQSSRVVDERDAGIKREREREQERKQYCLKFKSGKKPIYIKYYGLHIK